MPHSLDRFEKAQTNDYESALRELQSGLKRSHWMWYIFPQIRGLGQSEMAWRYGISDLTEARDYLLHPLLGRRLVECIRTILDQESPVISQIFPAPDDLKFASCMTLFSLVPDAPPEFNEAINRLLGGVRDPKTIKLLKDGVVNDTL